MLTEDIKQTIDSLSKEDLIHEINKGGRSRFQGERHDYLKTRLDLLGQQEQEQQVQQQLDLGAEANQIAKQANKLSSDANTTSNKAYRMSALSVIVAVVALLVALLPHCTSGH